MSYEIIKFENGNVELEVNVSPNEETAWLSKEQMAVLFDRDRSVVSRHIKMFSPKTSWMKKATCIFCTLHLQINQSHFIALMLLSTLGIE